MWVIGLAGPRSGNYNEWMAQVVAKMSLRLKRTQSAFGSCWSGYEFLTEKSSPEPEIKVHLEIHVTLRSVLLDFQLFTEKHVFWVCFRSCYDISFSHLVGNSMNRGSVICKLAKKWYLIRICASWLYPFNKGTQTEIVNLHRWTTTYYNWTPRRFTIWKGMGCLSEIFN